MQPDAEYYEHFGFPWCNLPKEGHPVTDADFCNTVKPILKGSAALLGTLAHALHGGAVNDHAASDALALLEGQLDFAVHVFDRWEQRPPKTKKEPGHGV